MKCVWGAPTNAGAQTDNCIRLADSNRQNVDQNRVRLRSAGWSWPNARINLASEARRAASEHLVACAEHNVHLLVAHNTPTWTNRWTRANGSRTWRPPFYPAASFALPPPLPVRATRLGTRAVRRRRSRGSGVPCRAPTGCSRRQSAPCVRYVGGRGELQSSRIYRAIRSLSQHESPIIRP